LISRRRGSLVLLAVGALVLLAVLLMLRGLDGPPAAQLAAAADAPRYELQGVNWTRLAADGTPLINATAQRARYYDDHSARFDSVRVERLGTPGGPWTVESPRGLMPADEKRIQLTRPVDMRGKQRNGEPIQVRAESLWIDLEKRELYTEDAVQLNAPHRQARARGLRADWQGTRVQLLNNVEVEYVPTPRG